MSSTPKDRIFSVLYPWMTSVLKLSGYDLVLFSYIHSITQSGTKTFFASAETISRLWYGDTSKTRTIKDSFKTLIALGYISVQHDTIGGRTRNVYISNGQTICDKIVKGIYTPQIPKKRRNREVSGTVPPSSPVSSYHYEGGTVPPTDSGTESQYNSGTVPPNNIIETIYQKYSLFKGVEINTKEEEKHFEIIFFFRNAKDPKAESQKFIIYNTKNDWGHGALSTHDKRIMVAEYQWEIQDGFRVEKNLMEFLRVLYVWGVSHHIDGTDCLLDTKTEGKSMDTNTYYLKCSAQVREWLESNTEIVRSVLHAELQSQFLYYI